MPVTAQDVARMLNALPMGGMFVGRREVKELPSLLHDSEEIVDLVQGFLGSGNGVLVATRRRLLFVDKGLIYGLRVEDFPYDKMSSIEYSTGIIFGEITIHASGNKALIKNVEKVRAKAFASHVRRLVEESKIAEKSAARPASGNTLAGELAHLDSLRSQGVLTDEEFSAAKRKLLGL